MRAADPSVQYLVGTPKGRLTWLEKALLAEAVARCPSRRAGEVARARRRALCVRREPRSVRQGACDAPAAIKVAVGAVEEAEHDGPPARCAADEARGR